MAAPRTLFTLRKNFCITKYFSTNAFVSTIRRCGPLQAGRNRMMSTFGKENGERGWRSRKRLISKIGLAAAVGVVTSTAVAGSPAVNDNTAHGSKSNQGPLAIKPTKHVRVETDNYGLRMTLFQYQTCPFCCKARAFLDYYGFSYDVVEVNSVWRTQTKWSSYKKVPILVIHGEKGNYLQLNDSSVIMSILESYLLDTNQPVDKLLSFYPSIESKNEKGKTEIDFPNKYFIMYQDMPVKTSKETIKQERKWRAWVDNVLVHSLSPNVYRTPSEALQAFRYFSDVGDWEKTFSTMERMVVIYVGAFAMYFVGKLLKNRYSLKDDVRQSLYEQCKDWTNALRKSGTPFLGGEQPNLADLSVYGVLNSIEGCDAFQDLLQNTKIQPWYDRMRRVVSHHGGANSSNKQR